MQKRDFSENYRNIGYTLQQLTTNKTTIQEEINKAIDKEIESVKNCEPNGILDDILNPFNIFNSEE